MGNERSLQGIIDLASAYYGSAVLFAALETDLFTRIAEARHPVTAEELAARAGLDPRGARLLLDACAAIGLLRKNGETYANTEAGRQALVTGGAHDVTQAIRYNRDVYAAWGQLAAFVRSGRPVEPPACHLGDDPERTRRFVLAMHGRAMGIGRMVVPMIDLAGCGRVLDLAGGPGTYAVLLAQAHPALRCVTVDLPAVSAVAAELVAAAGMTERVTCRAGDYHADIYEEAAYDAVTIFGALHQEAPEMIVSILTRACAALRPGGRLFVLDMMTDPTHTRPVFSALFAVNMALTTDHGWVFSDAELHAWMRQAGLEVCDTRPVPPPMPHWLVTARKPIH
ncbi:MAG TPA: methyltransferase [Kiritimatiellia bacterium]|nr:methyltransferase [Kiritimatiellia bacterium]HRU71081.1 methyltransferase [Kiritimatiellia bacterium]